MSLEDDNRDNERLERRLQRNTFIMIALALVAAALWSNARMVLGVLLGGALCLFNKRWLTGSVRTILRQAAEMQTGRVPPFAAAKFILRYYVIAIAIILGVWTGYAHPLGIGAGFAAFVGAVIMEAGYQLYLSFKEVSNAVPSNTEPFSENSSKE